MPINVRVTMEPDVTTAVGNEAVMQVRNGQHIQEGDDYILNATTLEQVVSLPDNGEIVITNVGVVSEVDSEQSAAVPKTPDEGAKAKTTPTPSTARGSEWLLGASRPKPPMKASGEASGKGR